MEKPVETATAAEKKHTVNWVALILWPFVILLLYVLSFGPVGMLQESGHISPGNEFLNKLYDPVVWAYEEYAAS